MNKLGKALLLGILLFFSATKAETPEQINNQIKGNPAFQKYQKYAIDFSARFAKEYSGEKEKLFSDASIEQDYQESAKLMNEVMKKSNIAIQDASDFQARFQAEKFAILKQNCYPCMIRIG